jgi:hypothetical protein
MAASRVFSRKAWFIPAIVLVFSVGLTAAGFSEDGRPAGRLPELVRLIGLDVCFNQIAPTLKSGLRQPLAAARTSGNAGQLDKVLEAVDAAADAAFAAGTLQREFLRTMEGRLNDGDLDTIFTFYQAPLGKRMTALENAHVLEGPDAMIKKADELRDLVKREPERAELLQQLDASLRLTQTSTDQMFNLARAIAIGMAAVDDKTTALPAEAIQVIDTALEKMRPAMEAQIREMLVLARIYTYRDASIPELRDYVAFLKSPAGQKLYGAAIPALHQTQLKAGTEFGHALMRELGKERI